MLRYVPQQYDHFYIDFRVGYGTYLSSISSKSRSTILRKIRKFEKFCGGTLDFRTFRTAEEIAQFFLYAPELSRRTYQDRLLQVGLPADPEFQRRALELAARDELRAFLLFHDGRAVAYLYCPARDGVLSYSYQGYDPDYLVHSAGTILLWSAIESIFRESKFLAFDFTEGSSEQKRLLASNHSRRCHVYFLRAHPGTLLLVHAHRFVDCASSTLGVILQRLGIKAKIRRILRFGLNTAAR